MHHSRWVPASLRLWLSWSPTTLLLLPLCTLLRVYIFIPLAAPDTMIRSCLCCVCTVDVCTYCLFTYNIRTCIWEEVVLCVCVCSEMMFSFIVPGGLITGKHCLVSPSCFIGSGAPRCSVQVQQSCGQVVCLCIQQSRQCSCIQFPVLRPEQLVCVCFTHEQTRSMSIHWKLIANEFLIDQQLPYTLYIHVYIRMYVHTYIAT